MSRRLNAAVLATVLMTAQSAFADDAAPLPPPAPVAPLAPGQAAGLQSAQANGQLNTIVIVAGAGLVAVAVFLIVGTNYHVHGQNQSSSGTK